MKQTVHAVNPVIESIVLRLWIPGLSWTAREPVGGMTLAGDVHYLKPEHENGHDPTVYSRGRFKVGVQQHSLDVSRVELDNERSEPDEPELQRSERSEEPVELELRLREPALSIVKRDTSESVVVSNLRVLEILLTKKIPHCDRRSVDA